MSINEQGTASTSGASAHSSSSLASLVKQRQYVRQKVTTIYNKVFNNPEDIVQSKIDLYTSRLEGLQNDLTNLDRSIFLESNDTDPTNAVANDEIYQEKIDLSIAALKTMIANNCPVATNNNSSQLVNSNFHALKLPMVQLPKYSNAPGEVLEKFFYDFESIVNKHTLSPYEKFVYLREQLDKSPRILVDSLNKTRQSYDHAKEILQKAFGSTLGQQYDTLKRLSQMKLSFGDDPYSYIGEINNMISSFENLEINTDIVLQYFIWQGLNDRFQNHLIQITNKSRPSLQDIQTHIFEATQRYSKHCEKVNSYKNNSNVKKGNFPNKDNSDTSMRSVALAVNVQNERGKNGSYKFPCILCVKDNKSNVNHSLKNCNAYSTAEQKRTKLHAIGACTKCAYSNHVESDCKYKFHSKCKKCSGEHMTFLCNNPPSSSLSTNVSISVVETTLINRSDNSIFLPTLSCDIFGNNVTSHVRILNDCGSQRNFVSQYINNKHKFKIVCDNVDLTIHGFHVSKTMKTVMVEIPLLLGDRSVCVEAVVVPKIEISIRIPELPLLVPEFIKRGFNLADKLLLECNSGVIDNFGIIIGSISNHIINASTVLFGSSGEESSYLHAHYGILFIGKASRMVENLPDLVAKSCSSQSNISLVSHDVDTCNVIQTSSEDTNISETIVQSVYTVTNENGELVESELEIAVDDALNKKCDEVLNVHRIPGDKIETEVNSELCNYVLSNTERQSDGRLIMPLMWNREIEHLLARNYTLCQQILKSNFRKISKYPDRLSMYNDVFKDQETKGVIEPIYDVDSYISEHPHCSFMAHMGVYKMNNDTTRLRVVYLSNLKDRSSPELVSHNQALLPGPCLNNKLSTAIINLRFDKYLLVFDICKAFLQIALKPIDQERLLFLWYRDVANGNFDLMAYRCTRLPFGLRSSPCILMLGLYKILILDLEHESDEMRQFCKLLYFLVYMDNCGYTSNDENEISSAYDKMPGIFAPYQIELQKYMTNYVPLQSTMDTNESLVTPDIVKLLGVNWDRLNDTISPAKIDMNVNANTKKQILSSVNSVYDLFNIYGPIMNRARLFLQTLQTDKSLGWNDKLPHSKLKVWGNIAKQANSTPIISIDRCIGRRDSVYCLVGFSDASQSIYGVVIYIVDLVENSVRYLLSKNRLIDGDMAKKSIPSLELQGISFAVENLIDLYNEFTGPKSVITLNITNIELYTDSLVCLHWLRSYSVDFSKMQKQSVFVLNRLKSIESACKLHSITFHHMEGRLNPADHISRPVSYNILSKTNYHSGPEFLTEPDWKPGDSTQEFTVSIPYSNKSTDNALLGDTHALHIDVTQTERSHVVSPERFSSLRKLVVTTQFVYKFIRSIKIKLNKDVDLDFGNHYEKVLSEILRRDQEIHFADIVSYFCEKSADSSPPELVSKLNLFQDSEGIIRVKCKLPSGSQFPILMSKSSSLTLLIISDAHERLGHSGAYSVLRELRPLFWIQNYFSLVRSVLRKCTLCV